MTENNCPRCGGSLADDAPGGICPKCLLAAGMASTGFGEPGKPDADGLEPELTLDAIRRDFPALEIVELIGRGGMGVVYKARQPTLDRLVALKVLSPRFKGDPAFAERFLREARALARLNHQNIVGLHDFGQTADRYYLIMEYVDGISLRQALREGSFTPDEALAIVPHICDALQYAHDEGIVHRDIKPENVLIDKKGRVKIADFGLAKLLVPSRDDFTLTGTREVMGTPHYMAPEQMEHPAQVDHRADIYALGVVFYEMLTGELPIGRFATPSQKVQVDVRLDDIVLRTLEREPERRYQKASQVKTDIETLACGAGAVGAALRPPAVSAELRERVQHAMHLPALGILIAGVIDLLCLLPLLFGGLGIADPMLRWLERVIAKYAGVGLQLPNPADFGDVLSWSLLFFALVGRSLAYGAIWMLSLKSHRQALRTCVLALLPVHPGFVISFWFGLVGLLRVTKPGVAAAFTEVERPSLASRVMAFLTAHRIAVTIAVALMAIAAPVVIDGLRKKAVPRFGNAQRRQPAAKPVKPATDTLQSSQIDDAGRRTALDLMATWSGPDRSYTPRSADADGNLLLNGSFEYGLEGWLEASPGVAFPASDLRIARVGKASARIDLEPKEGKAAIGGGLYQVVDTTSVVTFVRLSGWVRTQDARHVCVDVRGVNGGKEKDLREFKGTQDWTPFKVDLSLSGSTQLRVTAGIVGGGAAWFDDLKLEVTGTAPTDVELAVHEDIASRDTLAWEPPRGPDSEGNLLLNGGFGPSGEAALPDKWIGVAYGRASTRVLFLLEGSQGVLVVRPGGGIEWVSAIQQSIETTDTECTLRLTGRLQSTRSRRIFVDLRALDGGMEKKILEFSGSQAMTTFTLPLSLKGSKKLRVTVSLVGHGEVRLADFKLQVPEPSPPGLRTALEPSKRPMSKASGKTGPEYRVLVAKPDRRVIADEMVKALMADGFFGVEVEEEDGEPHVLVGKFASRDAAMNMCNQLKKDGFVLASVTGGDEKSAASSVPQVSAHDDGWKVLVGSRLDRNGAGALQQALQKDGYSAVEVRDNEDRADVLIGGCRLEKEAQVVLADLKKTGYKPEGIEGPEPAAMSTSVSARPGAADDAKPLEEALASARTSNKNVLAFFYSPEVPACKRLSDTVISTAEFKNLSQAFVYVAIDLSREPGTYLGRHGIHKVPCLAVIAPDGTLKRHAIGVLSIGDVKDLLQENAATTASRDLIRNANFSDAGTSGVPANWKLIVSETASADPADWWQDDPQKPAVVCRMDSGLALGRGGVVILAKPDNAATSAPITAAALYQDIALPSGKTVLVRGIVGGGGSVMLRIISSDGAVIEDVRCSEKSPHFSKQGVAWYEAATLAHVSPGARGRVFLLASFDKDEQASFAEVAVEEAAHQDAPGNLIVNGGFENLFRGSALRWDAPRYHSMSPVPPGEEGRVFIEQRSGRDGGNAATIALNPGRRRRDWRQDLRLKAPARALRVSGYVKTRDAGKVSVECCMERWHTSGTSDWMPFSFEAQVPSDRRGLVLLLTLEDSGQVWFDDIVLEAVGETTGTSAQHPFLITVNEPEEYPQAPRSAADSPAAMASVTNRIEEQDVPGNLLRNGGFGNLVNGWPIGWGKRDYASVDSQVTHSGNTAVTVRVPDSAGALRIGSRMRGIHQSVKSAVIGTSATALRLTGWVKTLAAEEAIVSVTGFSQGGAQRGNEDWTLSGTHDWTSFTLQLLGLRKDTDHYSIDATLMGAGQVWFDDLVLETVGGAAK